MKKSLTVSISYCLIHFLMEIICFSYLYSFFSSDALFWLFALLYDFLAFCLQGVIGSYYNSHFKLDLGYLGAGLIFVGMLIHNAFGIVILSVGNACLHEAGAFATTISGKGKMTYPSLFVAGGALGTVLGRMTSDYQWIRFSSISFIFLLLYACNHFWSMKDKQKIDIDILKMGINRNFIFWISFFVVCVRSYLGYCIPMSWNQKPWHVLLLYLMMAIGKALGGYCCDHFGFKKTMTFSTLLSLPFLVLGGNNMVVSIIGICLFSFTMAISYGIFLSLYPSNIGLAFGFTTLGLFMGMLPVYLFGSFSPLTSMILVIIFSFVSYFGLNYILK